ncbi:hypothetical protein SAY87_021923 [Trapa incisa]|uniref:Uncharacterized protein n=1 Tax=Trapa incisa TaxID=236973 RepID=A0AAN7PX18_9MYRT|nr:hypothetical protein SAY87_021923 [Trapa incisa]
MVLLPTQRAEAVQVVVAQGRRQRKFDFATVNGNKDSYILAYTKRSKAGEKLRSIEKRRLLKRAAAIGAVPEFHFCPNDEVVIGFRSWTGPVCRPKPKGNGLEEGVGLYSLL